MLSIKVKKLFTEKDMLMIKIRTVCFGDLLKMYTEGFHFSSSFKLISIKFS